MEAKGQPQRLSELCSTFLVLRQDLFVVPKLPGLARLVSQQAWDVPSWHWDYKHESLHSTFYIGSGAQT